MKRLVLLFLFLPSLVSAQRVTNIITSIINGGKTPESVSISSTSWSTDNGTITLSASVPATVKIGDTITDSNTNSYLITGISGSDLTAQDFDTATDPATGSATIQEAYQSITAWETDFGVTELYTAGDIAIGECYDDGGTFNENVVITDGTGFAGIRLVAASGEQHDGTEGTGVKLKGTSNANVLFFEYFSDKPVYIEGLEICPHSSADFKVLVTSSVVGTAAVSRCLLHRDGNTNTVRGIVVSAFRDNNRIQDNFIYDLAGWAIQSKDTDSFYDNNSIYGTAGNGFEQSGGSSTYRNNISVSNSGTDYSSITGTMTTNIDDDGSGDITSSAANLFVSVVSGSEDLHLKTGADAIDAGTDLGTTASGVEIDIDGWNRDSDTPSRDPWDIGAHEFEPVAGASTPAVRGNQILPIPWP